MAKKKTSGKGKVKKVESKPTRPVKAQPAIESKAPADLEPLRREVAKAQEVLQGAKEELARAGEAFSHAKRTYRDALVAYRAACQKAGTKSEFGGGRAENVSERIQFEVTKVRGENGDGIRVEVKGKPETAEVIPIETVRESIGKAAYAYTEKHLGPRDEIGNKGGTLTNRLRAILAA